MDYAAQVQAVADAQAQVERMTSAAYLTDQANIQANVNLQGARSILTSAKDALAVLLAQIKGPIGPYSSVDQLLQDERFAAKSASVDFIKANPDCAEADAIKVWTEAGIAATGLSALIVPAESYAAIYRMNLVKMGLVKDTSWESQRDWIIKTDKSTIMGA